MVRLGTPRRHRALGSPAGTQEFCHLPGVWLWASGPTSLSSVSQFGRMGLTILPVSQQFVRIQTLCM